MESRAAFLDTAFAYALLNTRDRWHARAVAWEQFLVGTPRRLLTTEFVLIEIADGLAALRFRSQAARILEVLQTSSLVEIVPAMSSLVAAGLALFQDRPDKDWGLTDCISFVVMEQRGLADALTSDQHFVQAGFRALLLEDPAKG
jgi:predicted nucleic acid-binding protein